VKIDLRTLAAGQGPRACVTHTPHAQVRRLCDLMIRVGGDRRRPRLSCQLYSESRRARKRPNLAGPAESGGGALVGASESIACAINCARRCIRLGADDDERRRHRCVANDDSMKRSHVDGPEWRRP
jgi:hypothetical protein